MKKIFAAAIAALAFGLAGPVSAQTAQELNTYKRIVALDVFIQDARQAQAERCTYAPTQVEYFACLRDFNAAITARQQQTAIEIAAGAKK